MSTNSTGGIGTAAALLLAASAGKYSAHGTAAGLTGYQKSLALSTLTCARVRKNFFCG